MHSSSDTGHHSLSDKFKSVFKVGQHGKKDHVDDIQPLGHGAHGKVCKTLHFASRQNVQSSERSVKQQQFLHPQLNWHHKKSFKVSLILT